MKIYKVIKVSIQFFLILNSLESFAGFGDSCSPISPSSDGYLEADTAYGYLKSNIDMTYKTSYCDASDPQFKFCLKNLDTATVPCTEITLNIGDTKSLQAISTNNPNLSDNPILQDIMLTVVRTTDNKLCLAMPTSRGQKPLACKNTSTPAPPTPSTDDQCQRAGESCYNSSAKSQSLFNFSGLAVECITETLNKVFYQYNVCASDQSTNDTQIALTELNPFPLFQESLKAAIRAAFIIYVMFFGFNMVLNKDYANLDKIATTVIKLVLVAYFAVGLGPIYFQAGKQTTQNGMLTYGLPMLTSIAPSLAQIVFNAGGSKGLCDFDLAKYPKGYTFYGVWDSIDCRIGYYLGMGLIYNTESILNGIPNTTTNLPTKNDATTDGSKPISSGSPVNLGTPGSDAPAALSKPGALRFFTVMFGFLLSGNIIMVAAGLVFCVIFVSIVLYFLTNYLVCLITIYVMTYISPIFIPMVLFTRTKAYFDAWLKVCISCALQPAVVAGFIALLLTMYDSAIYKKCQFMRHDYTYNDNTTFSTFEIRLPDQNTDECTNSAGYKLLRYYAGEGWEQHLAIIFSITTLQDAAMLLVDLLYVGVFSIIFYFFSQSIGQFAAEITGGPITDAVTASPTKIIDLAMKAAKFLKDARSGGKAKGNPLKPGSGGANKGRSGIAGESSKDSVAGGKDKSESPADKVATGNNEKGKGGE